VSDYFKIQSVCQNTRKLSAEQRFDLQYMPEPMSGCWLWIGSVRNEATPYGRLNVGGKTVIATRFSYERFIGPIPDGMFICHRCDNSLCVNPDHLFAGSPKDNMDDMIAKGRKYRQLGQTHWNCKLTDDDVRAIRASSAKSVDLAKQYGVSDKQIAKIRLGQRWKHVSIQEKAA
jgi:hypothetical protein